MSDQTSESRLRALIAQLVRYDLVTHYRCGDAVEEMEPSEGGDYVRFDDLEAALLAGVPPAEPGVPGSEVLCEACDAH